MNVRKSKKIKKLEKKSETIRSSWISMIEGIKGGHKRWAIDPMDSRIYRVDSVVLESLCMLDNFKYYYANNIYDEIPNSEQFYVTFQFEYNGIQSVCLEYVNNTIYGYKHRDFDYSVENDFSYINSKGDELIGKYFDINNDEAMLIRAHYNHVLWTVQEMLKDILACHWLGPVIDIQSVCNKMYNCKVNQNSTVFGMLTQSAENQSGISNAEFRTLIPDNNSVTSWEVFHQIINTMQNNSRYDHFSYADNLVCEEQSKLIEPNWVDYEEDYGIYSFKRFVYNILFESEDYEYRMDDNTLIHQSNMPWMIYSWLIDEIYFSVSILYCS